MEFDERFLCMSNYKQYIGIYNPKKLGDAKPSEDYCVITLNEKYAFITTRADIKYEKLRELTKDFIIFLERRDWFTLQAIDPIDSAGITAIQSLEFLNLTGKGVLVGTIDTGMNYLNKEFIDDNGNTRIDCIWDQTIISDKKIIGKINVKFGSLYSSEDINNAIKAYKDGKNPYEIVPSKDENSHGTKMAGIIGGKGIDPNIRGAAPECKYVVVKLIEDFNYKKEINSNINLYNIVSIFAGIQFLVDYSIVKNIPLVIYLPLSSNFTNHNSESLLENYIDDISVNKGLVIVTGTGNEGNAYNHTSGILKNVGDIQDVALYVDPIQEILKVQVWTRAPNIISINIISPSGEETGVIPAYLNMQETHKYVFEETTVLIKFYIPEESTADELIRLEFDTVKSGTWQIRLIANQILDGRYDLWLSQKGITLGETQFVDSDPYATFTSPGTALFVINTACYDQTQNYIENSSGRAFRDDFRDRIDVAVGGVKVTTTDISGEGYSVVSGTSVSAAVMAGACALLLEWGLIKGHSPNIHSQKIKTLLAGGTAKRPGDIYPNPQLGYGILDMIGVFKYIT